MRPKVERKLRQQAEISMSTKIKIGEQEDGAAVTLDVESLIYSRALIQANSGGGKSGLLRVIAEQVAAKIPTIIIDKEGEYYTLRERVDIVLVGEQGELAADVRSAGLLARKLIELGASAVIDLSGFRKAEPQQEFVRDFLDALINLPRKLWHPTFVMIDEAHFFAPEKGMGESVATASVVGLMTLGRKRGFCGVLATQRLSKLHKNAADVNNVFIGRTFLDLDQKRAARELGMSPTDAIILRDCPKQHFYSFGADLNFNGVAQFRVSDCQTKMPKPGDRATLTPPKASHVVMEIADKLKDLPQQAAAEIKDLNAAKARIRELEREVKAKPVIEKPVETIKTVEKPVLKDGQLSRLEKIVANLDGVITKHAEVGTVLVGVAREIQESVAKVSTNGHKAAPSVPAQSFSKSQPVIRTPPAPQAPSRRIDSNFEGSLPIGEQKILTALIQYPNGLERNQLTVLTGYKRSTRDAYIQRLGEKQFVEVRGGKVFATMNGHAALPEAEPLPTGEDLQRYWLERLPEGERAILKVLIEAYPEPVDREALTDATSYKRSTRDAYLQRLTSKELVERGGGPARASENLFL
jgi:hypothetical protein